MAGRVELAGTGLVVGEPRPRALLAQRLRTFVSDRARQTANLLSQAGDWTRREFNSTVSRGLGLQKYNPLQFLRRRQILPSEDVQALLSDYTGGLKQLLAYSREYIRLSEISKTVPVGCSDLEASYRDRTGFLLQQLKVFYERVNSAERRLNDPKVQKSIKVHSASSHGFQDFCSELFKDDAFQFFIGAKTDALGYEPDSPRIEKFFTFVRDRLLPGSPLGADDVGFTGQVLKHFPSFQSWTNGILKRTLVQDPAITEEQRTQESQVATRRADLQSHLERPVTSSSVMRLKPHRLSIEDPGVDLVLNQHIAKPDLHLDPIEDDQI